MKKRTILALLPILYFLTLFFSVFPPVYLGTGVFSRPIANQIANQTTTQIPSSKTAKTTQQTQTAQILQTAKTTTTSSYPQSSSYACILDSETYFCSAPDETRGIFLLPKTYYVKILEYSADYCKVEYLYDDGAAKRLTGYAKTEQLTFVDYVPKRPYLYYVFDAHYYINGDAQHADSAILDQITISCVYYGDFRIGAQLYCYVLRGDSFGYIPKPTTLYYEENPEYADYLAQNASSSQPNASAKSEKSASSPAQIGILVALCLLVPILAALILKPPRRPPYETDE
ncbi:MAG: hypothetical protein IKD47_06200 [Clostridia bacterium]|nr:hypothetical protein [Clostridia bacterium]